MGMIWVGKRDGWRPYFARQQEAVAVAVAATVSQVEQQQQQEQEGAGGESRVRGRVHHLAMRVNLPFLLLLVTCGLVLLLVSTSVVCHSRSSG